MREPVRFDAALADVLRRLGMAPVEVLVDLEEHWDEIAGDPWVGVSRPVVLRDGELVVEAMSGPAAGSVALRRRRPSPTSRFAARSRNRGPNSRPASRYTTMTSAIAVSLIRGREMPRRPVKRLDLHVCKATPERHFSRPFR